MHLLKGAVAVAALFIGYQVGKAVASRLTAPKTA